MIRLNHREEEVMQILWRLKKAFVKEIIAEMNQPAPPYNTISSIVRKLEKQGIIDHVPFGKTHQYFPVLKKEEYKKFSFKEMVRNYFGGSAENLLSFFATEENVDSALVEKLMEDIRRKNKIK